MSDKMEKLSTESRADVWSDYSQLYGILNASQIDALETAVLARKLGRLQQSLDIFETQFSETHVVPILALEKSFLYARFGLEKSRFLVLNDALEALSMWQQMSLDRVEDLLRINLAEAKMLAHGATRQALQDARMFRDKWTGPTISEWTDVDFGCALAYYSIIKFCYLHTKWVHVETDLVFSPAVRADSVVTLPQIVKTLTIQGKLNLALNFIRIHGDFLEGDARLLLYSRLIDDCVRKDDYNNRKTALVILDARLSLTHVMLSELNMRDEVEPILDNVRKQLLKMPWICVGDQHHRLLSKLEAERLPLLDTEPVANLSALAFSVHATGDRLMETQILSSSRSRMNQVDQLFRDSKWRQMDRGLSQRLASIHAHPSGNVMLRAMCGPGFVNGITTLGNHGDASEFLHKLAEFEAAYPDFDNPTVQQDLYLKASIAMRVLGRNHEAGLAEARKIQAMTNCRPDPTQFYRKYRDKPEAEWAPYVVEVILQWCELDIALGNLAVEEAAQMLLMPCNTIGTGHCTLEPNSVSSQSPHAVVQRLYGGLVPVDAETWEATFERFETWLWHSPGSVKKWIRHTILGDLQRGRCASMMKYVWEVNNDPHKMFNEDLQLDVRLAKARENQRLLKLCERLDRDAMGASAHSIVSQKFVCASDQVQLSTSAKAFRTKVVTDAGLRTIQDFLEEHSNSETMLPSSRLLALTQLASCKAQRYKLFGSIPADATLCDYERYDDLYMEQRLARSILKGMDNLVARAALVTAWSFTNHYDFALGHCMEAMGIAQLRRNFHRYIKQDMNYVPAQATSPSRDNSTLMTSFINWTQKKKARSVSEALGAEIVLPKAVLLNARLDDRAQTLLRKEADLQHKIEGDRGKILELNNEINLVRKEMRDCPSLKDIMKLRDGQALDRAQIGTLTASLGPSVTVVDYVHVPTGCTALLSNIMPMVYRDGMLRKAKLVTEVLDLAGIKRWIDSYMDETKPLLTDEPVLRDLFPLVEAVVELSNPGDSIVFCPTDALFRLPLHAIELPDGQTLIERNPIIYTQSLTVLRHCQAAAASRDLSEEPKILAVQALPDKDRVRSEAADMDFASRIGARLLEGDSLTKCSFLGASEEADLIHFYGHVSFDQAEPMNQFLAIRDLKTENVTVRDLFDLRLRAGAHVNLIGCQSGRSQIRTNDDLFGLSTAFMFAGASSIIASLWSIQMDDAAAFQEAFFDDIIQQSHTAHEKQKAGETSQSNSLHRVCLDFALANQQAVIKIMRDSAGRIRAPYHRAAFFLQGCWNQFPILEV